MAPSNLLSTVRFRLTPIDIPRSSYTTGRYTNVHCIVRHVKEILYIKEYPAREKKPVCNNSFTRACVRVQGFEMW